jgi:GT2 family glycosyltransferase
MTLAVIIPTFNRRDSLAALLKNIYDIAVPEMTLHIVVVVDGSTDGTLDMLAGKFSGVHIVQGTGDWWYTRCINEGMAYARDLQPDYILTLNDDLLLDRNYFRNIYRYSLEPIRNAIVGSVTFTVEQPVRMVSSGVSSLNRISFRAKHYIRLFAPVNPEELTGVHRSEVLVGRGMLIPLYIIESLGFFDPYFIQFIFTVRDHPFY